MTAKQLTKEGSPSPACNKTEKLIVRPKKEIKQNRRMNTRKRRKMYTILWLANNRGSQEVAIYSKSFIMPKKGEMTKLLIFKKFESIKFSP